MPGWLKLPELPSSGHSAGGLRRWLLEPRYPSVAFDLDPKNLAMVRIGRRKKERFIASYRVEALPEDLIEMDFYKVRLTQPDTFRAAVQNLLKDEPEKVLRASLLLPDNYARVAILQFDDFPRRRSDAIQLVRWKTKKAVPFKVEEAVVDYMPLPSAESGVKILAVLMPKSVIEEFEAVFNSMGIQAGLVDLSTLSLLNLYRPVLSAELRSGEECLVANVSGGFVTYVIFRGEQMVLFRCKPFATGVEDAAGEGALRLMRRELQASLLYYREKLDGTGIARAYLRVVGHEPERVHAVFADQEDIAEIRPLDPKPMIDVDGRLSGEDGEAVLQRLSPALGAVLGRSRT